MTPLQGLEALLSAFEISEDDTHLPFDSLDASILSGLSYINRISQRLPLKVDFTRISLCFS